MGWFGGRKPEQKTAIVDCWRWAKNRGVVMTLFPTFEASDEPPPRPVSSVPPQASRLAPRLRALADRGVYFGTSSWKYSGWLDSIYSREKYMTHGKFSEAKFERDCLAEYASTFPTVCGDFAFYQFPTADYWQKLFAATPASFLFSFKVPEDITVPLWPTHPRYGTRAGQKNDGFLNAAVFTTYFTDRLELHRNRLASLIFEFGTFAKSTFPKPEDFYGRLDAFLSALPEGFRYSVEIRNPDYLSPEYFDLLASHNVAHVLNAWTRMPELQHQIKLPGVYTADFVVVRALLKYGRTYERAVQAFEPYDKLQEPNPEGCRAMWQIAEHALHHRKQAYINVNNRFSGNAPATIESVINLFDNS
jgi:uncharacterized protein YecE (DUF72 family)